MSYYGKCQNKPPKYFISQTSDDYNKINDKIMHITVINHTTDPWAHL